MSTMFDCKADEIFQCQDSTQAACSSGNSVVKESSSGYFLVKNLQTLVKSPHNSSDKKKKKKGCERTMKSWKKNYTK